MEVIEDIIRYIRKQKSQNQQASNFHPYANFNWPYLKSDVCDLFRVVVIYQKDANVNAWLQVCGVEKKVQKHEHVDGSACQKSPALSTIHWLGALFQNVHNFTSAGRWF